MDEAEYVEAASPDPALVWDADALARLASRQVPDAVLGRRRGLLRADAGQQWAAWFVEGFADPRRYVGPDPNYAKVFGDVIGVVNRRFSGHTRSDRQRIASAVSNSVLGAVVALTAAGRRTRIEQGRRSLLLDAAGDPARCWICGSAFEQEALDAFTRAETADARIPAFVDILKPRGLSPRDGRVEIDHVVPVALGGEDDDNLALACGWCNRHKGARTSIYDVEGRPRNAGPNRFGVTSLPQPFWIVRQLGVVSHCEHVGGCQRDASNASMTVAPAHHHGAMNPGNLVTTCLEHDPLRATRLQPPEVVRTLWAG